MVPTRSRGPTSDPDDLPGRFRRVYHHLYTHGRASRAEALLADLSRLLLVKLQAEVDDVARDRLARFLAGEASSTEALLPGLAAAYPGLVGDGERFVLEDRSLRQALAELADVALSQRAAHVVGEAVQALVGPRIRGERGQFFTPRALVRAIVEVIAPQPGESILDPACGTGGFLYEAIAHVEARGGAPGRIAGADKDQGLARLAGAILAVRGRDARVAAIDSLRASAWAESGLGDGFDVILSNPPFGARIPIRDPEVLGGFALAREWRFDRAADRYAISDTRRDHQDPQVLFLELCLRKLRPGGRLAIVLPEGLFGNKQESYLWDFVRDHAEILALLDCPRTTFQPGTDTKTNVLFLRRRVDGERRASEGGSRSSGGGSPAREGEPQAREDESKVCDDESQTREGESQTREGESRTREGESQTREGESETRDGRSHSRADRSQTREDDSQARAVGPRVQIAVALACGHDRRGRTRRADGSAHPDDLPAIGEGLALAPTIRRVGDRWREVTLHRPYYLVPRYYQDEVPTSPAEASLCAGARWATIGELARDGVVELRKGHEVGSEAYGGGEVPFVRTSDLANFEVSADPTRSVSDEVYQRFAPQQRLRAGSILMVVDGRYRIGAAAILTARTTRCVVQSHLQIVDVVDPAALDPYALLYALAMPAVRRRIRDLVFVQSTLGTLGARLRELRIPILHGDGPWSGALARFRGALEARDRMLGVLGELVGAEPEL